MKFFVFLMLFALPAHAWQPVVHKDGTAYRLDGEKISGGAETGAQVYILIEPEILLPALLPDTDASGERLSYRNIIFNYGDSYICGPRREVKVTIDDRLIREREAGVDYDWHIFLKGFLTTHYGEVLTYESMSAPDGSDVAAQMLRAKQTVTLERKLDNCGDDGVFVFPLGD